MKVLLLLLVALRLVLVLVRESRARLAAAENGSEVGDWVDRAVNDVGELRRR